MTRLVCIVFLVVAGSGLGCGMGLFDEESGGADNLPTQGAGPYGKPDVDFDTPADEPYVLADRQASLTDPTALARDDGGYRIWFARQVEDTVPSAEIWMAEIPTIFDLPDVAPQAVMVADQAWEEGNVTEPAVIELAGGALVMFYRGGATAGAIGRADSNDGGRSWQKHPSNPLLTDAAEPTVALLDGRWQLYFTRPGTPGIFRAESTDGIGWTTDAEPVIVHRPDLIGAFDRVAVSDPHVAARHTQAGQSHFGLFFNGLNDDGFASIGYAGSFDGVDWVRFFGPDPVLSGMPPSENSPAAVLGTTTGTLFFSEERLNRQRIGVAVHP
jgi:hypothetical protein